MSNRPCPAALNIMGEHFPCTQMEQMAPGSKNHDGWAHSNRDAEAIWQGDPSETEVAWDRGYTSGHSIAMRRMSDEPQAPTPTNPYKQKENAGA